MILLILYEGLMHKKKLPEPAAWFWLNQKKTLLDICFAAAELKETNFLSHQNEPLGKTPAFLKKIFNPKR